jgi:exopolyphosphatase/guanosine-5'-triphosphate,3'-diphosphate pyrophosphatase
MGKPQCTGALRVASLDIGSNSTRLLVAEIEKGQLFKRLYSARRTTRLAAGLQASGIIDAGAGRRTLEAVCAFVEEARRFDIAYMLAAATSAVREASNGASFISSVQEQAGLEIRLLSGRQEAEWMMCGVLLSWSHIPCRWLLVDLGGGSTELVAAHRDQTEAVESVPLGMVRLTEEVFHHDPPTPVEIEECRKIARSSLCKVLNRLDRQYRPPEVLVGTAGTITTLAALDMAMESYAGERVHGYRLSGVRVQAWIETLAAKSASQRRELPGMEAGREDVILAGAVLVDEIMGAVGAGEMQVSDYGLLEGAAWMAAETARNTIES